jgi:hypothetical protein
MKKTLLLLLVLPLLTFAQFPETFSGTTFPPTGWTSFVGANGLGTTQNWKREAFETGNFTAVCVWEVLPTGQRSQDWLVTPQVAITAANKNLLFQSIDSGTTDYGSIYTVRISTTSQTDINSFTIIDTQNETQIAHSQTTMSVAGSQRTIDLSAYIGQSIYVAFVLDQNDGDLWRIDNVNFVGCPVPVTTAGTFTDNSAVVNFATSGNYQIEYGVYPFTQGSGSGVMTETVTAGSTKTLTGLTPGVSYSVYTRTDCGSGTYSNWSPEILVGTSNTIQENVPYSSGFEAAANQAFLYNLGWTSATGNVGTWGWFKDGATAPFYADSGIYHVGSAINTTTARNAYLYSKPIAMTGGVLYQITYKYRAFSSEATTIPMAFRVVTNTTNTSTGVNVLTTKTGINNTSYISETLQFTPATTGNYYIGFHNNTPAATGATTNNFIFIDTFSISTNMSIENFDKDAISLYPNPTSSILNISNTNNVEIKNISVTDINGRVVKNQAGSLTQINVSDLNAGVYFVTIEAAEGKTTKKFIKQ